MALHGVQRTGPKNKVVRHAVGQAGPPAAPAEVATCQCKPLTAAWKDLQKIRNKLREVAMIEERAVAGAKVDPLQRQKLAQRRP